MSYVLTDFVNCEAIQDELNGKFGCDKTKLLQPSEASLVQFLFSPANTANMLQRQISDGNKVKDVKLVYQPRIPLGAVGTAITPDDCTSTVKRGQRSQTYTIDENVGVQIDWVVDTEDLIRICKDNKTYVSDEIMRAMNVLIRRMDPILAAQTIALSGNFGEAEEGVVGGIKSVRTRKTASGATMNDVSTDFIEEISFAGDNAGYCGPSIVLGYHEVYKAFKAIDASNCCSDAGINIAQLTSLAGTTFIPNRNIPKVANNNSFFIGLDAGAVQVLTYNRYLTEDGVMGVNLGNSQTTTIIDPRYGIPFDLRVEYSCGKWHFFMSLAFKAVGVPADIFEDEDIFDGVTGVNKYLVNNS